MYFEIAHLKSHFSWVLISLSLLYWYWTQLMFPGNDEVDCSTHLPLDKKAAILVDNNFKCIFFNANDFSFTEIFLRSPVDNKPALVQVMVTTGDKPLTELMLTQFTDAYRQH